MSYEEITQKLTDEDLRIAGEFEAGWTYTYINDEGERLTLWVTDSE